MHMKIEQHKEFTKLQLLLTATACKCNLAQRLMVFAQLAYLQLRYCRWTTNQVAFIFSLQHKYLYGRNTIVILLIITVN